MAKITVTPDPLVVGSDVEICISEGEPLATVTLEIDDGADPSTAETFDITLEKQGIGYVYWEIPAWSRVRFRADGCADLTLPIQAR